MHHKNNFINVEEISHYLKDIKKLPIADKERLDVILKNLKRKDLTKEQKSENLLELVKVI